MLAVIAHLILTRTVYGRYLRAIGENERAAAYTGLPVRGVRLATYIGCGALAALAGLIHAARSHQGNPNDGVGYELDAIAAVVIGGTALAGGRGSIVGTVTGALVLGLLTNVLRLHMVDSNLELMIKAVIIIVAVWLQRRSTGVHGELVIPGCGPRFWSARSACWPVAPKRRRASATPSSSASATMPSPIARRKTPR